MEDTNHLKIVSVMSLQEPPALISTSKVQQERPLLGLIKHLMSYNNETTVLSNAQLLEILSKEYDLNVSNCHPLEIDIYVSVIKKFLKSWPRWEVIFPEDSNHEQKMYEEYQLLKNYLREMLDLSKKPTDEAVEKIKKIQQSFQTEGVMEVTCSNKQLHKLFLQKPSLDNSNTIFNVKSLIQEKISLITLDINEIFNWPFVNVHIFSRLLEFTHRNCSNFVRTLVNKKLKSYRPPPPMSNQVLYRPKYKTPKKMSIVKKSEVLQIVNQILELLDKHKDDTNTVAKTLFQLVQQDLRVSPDEIDKTVTYKYYLCKDPYVRHFTNPVEGQDADFDRYDLVLEEFITPSVSFDINSVAAVPIGNADIASLFRPSVNWFKVECTMCDKFFFGFTSIELLKQHFNEEHCDEQDWRCVKCNKSFMSRSLAAQRWKHVCELCI